MKTPNYLLLSLTISHSEGTAIRDMIDANLNLHTCESKPVLFSLIKACISLCFKNFGENGYKIKSTYLGITPFLTAFNISVSRSHIIT